MQSATRSLGLAANNLSRQIRSRSLTRSNIRNSTTTHNRPNQSLTTPLRNTLLYTGALTVGGILGVATGEYFLTDSTKTAFVSTRTINATPDSKYSNFPFKITLYQYDTCLYSTQVRTYLDYFGFSYDLVEVDSTSKRSLKEFTNARQLPIVVLKDTATSEEWHLTNATAILSALESLRCYVGREKNEAILTKYLPVLNGKVLNYQKNPFKYYIHNSDLNSVEMRRWVNNSAAPAFKSTATANIKSTRELIDLYSSRSQWKTRYTHSSLKYYYVYYTSFLREYFEYYGNQRDLDSVLSKWETELDSKKFMNGDECPNLADLMMYATASTFESMSFFRRFLSRHDKFKAWYKNMKNFIYKGSQTRPVETKDVAVCTDKEVETVVEVLEKEDYDNIGRNNLRILTLNYLFHIMAFTYAAFNSSR